MTHKEVLKVKIFSSLVPNVLAQWRKKLQAPHTIWIKRYCVYPVSGSLGLQPLGSYSKLKAPVHFKFEGIYGAV